MAKEYRTDYLVAYADSINNGHGFGSVHIINKSPKKNALPTYKDVEEWRESIMKKNPHFTEVVILSYSKLGASNGS